MITGVQPGGIVVVRFAGESRDRSLMADVAPIRKRVEIRTPEVGLAAFESGRGT